MRLDSASLQLWLWAPESSGGKGVGARGRGHWVVEWLVIPALLADTTSRLLSLLARPGFIMLPNSPPYKMKKGNQNGDSHQLNCVKEVDFTVFSPAASPWDKEVLFERKWISPGLLPCTVLSVRGECSCFIWVTLASRVMSVWSPWAVVRQETFPRSPEACG